MTLPTSSTHAESDSGLLDQLQKPPPAHLLHEGGSRNLGELAQGGDGPGVVFLDVTKGGLDIGVVHKSTNLRLGACALGGRGRRDGKQECDGEEGRNQMGGVTAHGSLWVQNA